MEVSTQISYNGYRANYKITSLNSVYYHAELIDFSGLQIEPPPCKINFIKINGRAIASSDVIRIVRELLKEFSPEPGKHHEANLSN